MFFLLPLEADLMRHCGLVAAQKYQAVLALINLSFHVGISHVLRRVVQVFLAMRVTVADFT